MLTFLLHKRLDTRWNALYAVQFINGIKSGHIDLHQLHAIFPIISLCVFIKSNKTLFHEEKVLEQRESTVYLLLIRGAGSAVLSNIPKRSLLIFGQRLPFHMIGKPTIWIANSPLVFCKHVTPHWQRSGANAYRLTPRRWNRSGEGQRLRFVLFHRWFSYRGSRKVNVCKAEY